MTQLQALSYLKTREARSREQAAEAVDVCARMAHLAFAENYAARIAILDRVELQA